MGHTNGSVHAFTACDVRSIMTDATGKLVHWLLCLAHGEAVICADEYCWHHSKEFTTHGDSTATPDPF